MQALNDAGSQTTVATFLEESDKYDKDGKIIREYDLVKLSACFRSIKFW